MKALVYGGPGRREWKNVPKPEIKDATDATVRVTVISCGAALHHLRVALAALGWRAIVHRLPNPGQPDHLAAIEFQFNADPLPATPRRPVIDVLTRQEQP